MTDIDPHIQRNLVDRIALVFEHSGLSPLAGRIVGSLLMCWPPEQSSAQLAEYLNASKGAISTTTRFLIEAGLIERVRMRGSRAMWFRVRRGMWSDLLHAEVHRVSTLRRIADEALEAMADLPEERAERLVEFRKVNAFFEEELPAVLERWDAQFAGEES